MTKSSLFVKILSLVSLVLVLAGTFINFNLKELPTAILALIIVVVFLMDKIDKIPFICIILLDNITNIIINFNTDFKSILFNVLSIIIWILFLFPKKNSKEKQ